MAAHYKLAPGMVPPTHWGYPRPNGTRTVPLIPRVWYNAPRNFDSVSGAMLTLFEVSTLDHWTEVLFLVMDAPFKPGRANGWKRGQRWPFALVVALLVVLGYYLLINLLVCGVVAVYDRLSVDSRRNTSLSRGQRELIDAVNLMLRTRPGYRQVCAAITRTLFFIRCACSPVPFWCTRV